MGASANGRRTRLVGERKNIERERERDNQDSSRHQYLLTTNTSQTINVS